MYKKIIFFYILLNIFNINIYAKSFNIIATVNNIAITHIDLENEIKILSILNKKEIKTISKNIALNNLIDEIIKKEEIKKEKLIMDDKLIDQYLLTLIKNLNIDVNKIDENLAMLIKTKIVTDNLWNKLIIQKYGWKININMKEIDQKINNLQKQKNILEKNLKENLILEEKNKKLAVFAKYHLSKSKQQSSINLIK